MLYGLDVGGTKIELAIFDEQLQLVDSWRQPTPKQSYAEFLDAIADMVARADRLTEGEGSVGIGLPGFFDADDKMVAANIPGINGRALRQDLSARLSRPVGFENDVNAFVVSEVNGGALSNRNLALGVVLGTGLAGGFYANGQLCRGRQNVACEFGHIPLSAALQQKYDLPLRYCGCGLQGCVETYLSGPGLQWLCSHFDSGYSTVESMVQGLKQDEDKAHKVFDAYLDCLGSFLAQLTLTYDPEAIVLGGGLSNITELYPRINGAIQHHLFRSATPPPVLPPQFGDSSGVRGAALIGQQVVMDD
ncbi:MAG: ROK family protein [Porticoccaceae bacterium]|nr:ROK family protein [Porticoccaceae bacterium]